MLQAISPTVQGAAYNFGFALGQWLFGANDNSAAAAAQQQTYLAELQKMRKEAEHQRLLAEQQRVQAIFDRLKHELMGIDKNPDLKLMGIDKSPDLQLMGIDNGPGLQLMLGDNSSSTPKSNGVGSKPQLGDNSDGDSTNPCRLTDVPGLPGLDICNHTSAFISNGSPIRLAQAAQSLSGPEQVVVEDSALHAAETKPELMSPSQDPRVTSFQAADADYQKAQQAQAQAAQMNDQARQEYESAADALKTAQSEVASHEAAGAPAPSPALQQALSDLSLAARTDEAASVRAQQQFDALNADLAVRRTKAVNSLAAVIAPPNDASVVDLRDTRQPLVPQNPSPNAGPATSTPLALATAPTGLGGSSAPGAPIFDCPGDRAAVARLTTGLPVQEEAIKRTEAALNAATKDSADARTKLDVSAVMTLNAAAVRIADGAERLLAREEGKNARGLPGDAAARFKFLQLLKEIAGLSTDLATETRGAAELRQSAEAGTNFANEEKELMAKNTQSLSDHMAELKKLFVESGMVKEMKEEAPDLLAKWVAFFLLGPVGAADVDLITSGRDMLLDSLETASNVIDARKIERNLDLLRIQRVRIRERIEELQREMTENCSALTGLAATAQ
jgi:hypothetical protein